MALLDAALEGKIEILLSVALALEYEAVLSREEHLSASELTRIEVEGLLRALCSVAIQVRIERNWRPQLRDQDNEMVLETAINGRAEGIVTFNRTDFETAAKRFGMAVLLPRQALELEREDLR